MANRIIGLDLGTYSIKVIHLEVGRDTRVIGYDEEVIAPHAPAPAPDRSAGVEHASGEFETTDVFDTQRLNAPELEHGEIDPHVPQNEHEFVSDGDSEPELPDDAHFDESSGAEQWSAEFGSEDVFEEPMIPWVKALSELALRGNFDHSETVVTFLPDGKAMTVQLDVPFDTKAKVSSILPHLLADKLPVAPHQVVYDFMVTSGSRREEYEAIVGFARKDVMAEFLGHLGPLSINPAVVGIPEFMLKYLADRVTASGDECFAVLDLGHHFTRLLIVDQGRIIVDRSIFRGGHHLTGAIAERFGVTYHEAQEIKHSRGSLLSASRRASSPQDMALEQTIVQASIPLVRDLRRTFQAAYARYRVQVDGVYLCGGASMLNDMDAYLQQEFQVPVHRVDIDRALAFDLEQNMHTSKAHLAMGVSLALQYEDDRAQHRLINLRQNEFAYRGKSSYMRAQFLQLAAAVAVVFILFSAVLFTKRMDYQAERDAMREALTAQTQQLFGDALVSQTAIQQRLSGAEGSQQGFVPKMSAYELMYNLVSHMPEDIEVEVDRFEVDVDRNLIQIVGVTTDVQSVDRLASRIEGLKCLREVRKDRLQVRGESRTEFELHISSGCS